MILRSRRSRLASVCFSAGVLCFGPSVLGASAAKDDSSGALKLETARAGAERLEIGRLSALGQGGLGSVVGGTGIRPQTECNYAIPGDDSAVDTLSRIRLGRPGGSKSFAADRPTVVPRTVSSRLVGLVRSTDRGYLVVADTLSQASCDSGASGGWTGQERLFVSRSLASGKSDESFNLPGSPWVDLTQTSGTTGADAVVGTPRGFTTALSASGSAGEIELTRFSTADSTGVATDTEFGSNGTATAPQSDASALDLAQRGERIILLGSSRETAGRPGTLFVAAFDANGLDLSFGDGGVREVDFAGFDDDSLGRVSVDAQGRPLIAARLYGGEASAFGVGVARLTSDGDLDTSFSDDGQLALGSDRVGDPRDAPDVAVVGRKLVVAFSSVRRGAALERPWTAARILPTGELDRGFGRDGVRRFNDIRGRGVGIVDGSSTLYGIFRDGGRDKLATLSGLNAGGSFRQR